MFSLLYSLIKCGFVIVVFIFLVSYWMSNKSYTFDAKSVAKVAEKYVGKDPREAYDDIYKEFAAAYPGHVLPADDLQWIFMNAGGWMGSMCILHASITEYLIFFGTGIDTSGNSGRYWANISDTILTGSFRQWQEGYIHSQVFEPGATVYHHFGEAAAVQWTAGTWMVEYGRGFIPSTLGFALADTLFSTQDFVTLFYILKVYAKALMMEMGTFLTEHKDNLFG